MLYSHNNEDDIPYFEHIKMFQELKENDEVYLVNLKTLDLLKGEVIDLEKENKTETVYRKTFILENKIETVYGKSFGSNVISQDREFEYTSVSFRLKTISNNNINIHFGTETNYLMSNENIVICTTEREAKQIISILKAKCEIQMSQFKSIFNGAGFNYEPRHYKIR